jgi:glycosyltransferase involved in cell wall biosynthesis
MHSAFLTTSLSRLSGGLFVLMRGLAMGLREQGDAVTIFGVDDAHTPDDLPSWLPLDARAYPARGPRAFGAAAGYASALNRTPADLVHNHGLWQYASLVTQRWARHTRKPYLVSPQGMLDPWALANGRWKKRIVAAWFQDAQLQRASCLHAVGESEAQAIRAYGLRNPICIIPNGIELPPPKTTQPPPWHATIEQGRPVLLFLGRLHPKKGLTELLEAWAPIPKDWTLAIAGWDQGGFRAQLEQRAAKNVIFLGPLHGDAKAAAFQHASAFILPSHSEGMPAAVLEAWSYGLPVIMTPACNIPEGFTANAAIRITPDPASIRDGLATLFSMSAPDRHTMGQRGLHLVTTRFSWPILARNMHATYAWLLGGGSPPACLQLK